MNKKKKRSPLNLKVTFIQSKKSVFLLYKLDFYSGYLSQFTTPYRSSLVYCFLSRPFVVYLCVRSGRRVEGVSIGFHSNCSRTNIVLLYKEKRQLLLDISRTDEIELIRLH